MRHLHDKIDRAVAEAYGWPADLPERIVLVRDLIARQSSPADLDALAASFRRRPKADDLAGIVSALVQVGVAREIENGRYVA